MSTPTADPCSPPLASTDAKSWALYYHSLGLHPLPMRPDKKAPYLDEWKPFQERQPTLDELDGWDWRFGVGITTNGMMLVDCDGGGEQLIGGRPFPPSWTVRTGRGGLHRYYRTPPGRPWGNPVALFQEKGRGQVDIKADGGFAVLPPTLHPETRKRYEWLIPPWAPIRLADAPQWLLEEIQRRAAGSRNGNSTAPQQTEPWITELLRGVPEGQRNDGAARLAGYFAAKGIPEDVAIPLLEGYAARCLPPFAPHELHETVHSIYTTHARSVAAEPRSVQDGDTQVVLVPLSAIAPERVSWLWPGRIPRGKVSLIIGDPGQGKSCLCLDLAARVSTGGKWPGGIPAPHGAVVLLTAEDGTADTVRPRVDAAGGNPARIHVLKGVRDKEGERGFDLTQDVPHLEAAIVSTGAIMAVIDPVSAYLGSTDSYRDSEVRGVLAPVAALAERTGAAILGVMHLTKNQQRQVLHRAQGNIAFVGAARAVFAVAEDRDNPGRQLFLPVKMNVAKKPVGLAFRLEEAGEVVRVAWDVEPVTIDADAALAAPELPEERSEREDAAEFLREALAGGPMEAETVKKQARQAGIADRTLWRAKGRLGVKARKNGFGGAGGWLWELSKSATPY